MSTAPTTSPTVRELTIRGIILGALITLVFTAANVYLGLKVGLTFATAIPAAVISMSILRYFADHSVIENNIVQTLASAAGTLSAIIFVLPGLVMIGWWTGFPYWITVAVCTVGGILGVMYSIPLRRALVTGSDLPYPEGVAAAEVLKVGDSTRGAEENRTGMRMILTGGLVAVGFTLLTSLKVLAGSISHVFRLGTGATMFGASLSLALIGIGHLVGLAVGVAMFAGILISFGVLLPIRTTGALGTGEMADVVATTFATEVRFVGAGAIAVAAVWTLLKIIGPIVTGIRAALLSARQRRAGTAVALTEQDIPFPYLVVVSVVAMIPIGLLLWDFSRGTVLHGSAAGIIAVSLVFVVIMGLVVAAVCGYMAGLIGSSNSPISGVGILMVVIGALMIKAVFGAADDSQSTALVAYTLFTAAIVFSIATISNDNLQDLKTGQLVGATPWRQQVAQIIGVIVGAAIIPPVLQLMHTAFGFAGAPDAGPNALAAPQAALISSLALGVFGGSLNWGLIGLGGLIGVGVIVVDEILARATKYRLPPLAVGMGMYLPIGLTLTISIGSVVGRLYNSWAERGGQAELKKRLGVLLATGLIVGESLYGVLFAGIVAASGRDDPLAVVGDGFAGWAEILGILAFVAIVVWLYRRTRTTATGRASLHRELD